MKKIILSLAVIIAFVAYAYFMRSDSEDSAGVVKAPSSTNATTSTITYKDGEYTGSVADAYYGNVQVKAVIKNGKIDDVLFLLYPNDRQTSERINEQAMPFLKQEAIQAQSAEVDTVSGATQTSLGFKASLTAALSQAK